MVNIMANIYNFITFVCLFIIVMVHHTLNAHAYINLWTRNYIYLHLIRVWRGYLDLRDPCANLGDCDGRRRSRNPQKSGRVPPRLPSCEYKDERTTSCADQHSRYPLLIIASAKNCCPHLGICLFYPLI